MRSITFINTNPTQTKREREIIRSQASSHAASFTIAERRKAQAKAKSKSAGGRLRALRPKSPPRLAASEGDSEPNRDDDPTPSNTATAEIAEWIFDNQTAAISTQLLPEIEERDTDWATHFDYETKCAPYAYDHYTSSSQCRCEGQCKCAMSRNSDGRETGHAKADEARMIFMPDQPAQRINWQANELEDLQFFLGVVGSTARPLSDSSFFNIIIPCLSELNFGIRYLVSAIACTYRMHVVPRGGERTSPALNIKALSHFEKASQALSRQSTSLPNEILQASCILMASWYSIRLELAAAASCVRLAVNLCHMRFDESVVEHRAAWTLPYEDDVDRLHKTLLYGNPSRVQNSDFQDTIERTISKRAVEGLPVVFRQTLRQKLDENHKLRREHTEPLILASGRNFRPLNSFADIVHNIAMLMPIWERLFGNTTDNARIDPNGRLAKDLLSTMQMLLLSLEQRSFGVSNSSNVVTHRETNFGVGVLYHLIQLQCTLLIPRTAHYSFQMLVWDLHIAAFDSIVTWAEEYLSTTATPANFEYLPTGMVVRPLWFVGLHCRDPVIRRRAITCLTTYHRNEAGLDSWTAGHIASTIMHLEERNNASGGEYAAADILAQDRVSLLDFEYVEGSRRAYMLYTHAAALDQNSRLMLRKHKLEIPEDPHGVVRARKPRRDVDHLKVLLEYMSRARREDAGGRGYVRRMWYIGEEVEVWVAD